MIIQYMLEPSVEWWIYAVFSGDTKIVNLLIKNGAKLDVVSKNGNTALRISAIEGHTGVAQALIKAGAKVNLDKNEENAIYNWHPKVVKVLIDLDYTSDMLIEAANNGYAKTVNFLIKEGAKS